MKQLYFVAAVLLFGWSSSALISPPHSLPVLSSSFSEQVRYSTVRIVAAEGGGNLTRCTGVLIAQDWVLTAAHCLDEDKMDVQFPELGDLKFKKESSRADFPLQVKSNKVFIHPLYAYSGGGYAFDIGLIHLAQPAPSPYRPAVRIQGQLRVQLPENVIMGGFGYKVTQPPPKGYVEDSSLTFLPRTISTDTQKFNYPFYRSTYEKREEFPIWSWSQDNSSLAKICMGDSGGPLYEVRDDQVYLIGINGAYEGAEGQCTGDALAINVDYHDLFIQAVMRDTAVPKIDQLAKVVNEENSFGGLWPYSPERSVHPSSSNRFEIYLTNNETQVCAKPRPMNHLGDRREFIGLWQKPNSTEALLGLESNFEIQWNDNSRQSLKFQMTKADQIFVRREGDWLTKLAITPTGPQLSRIKIVNCGQ